MSPPQSTAVLRDSAGRAGPLGFAEVLNWDIKYRTNKGNGDIFGASPRTVNTYLQRGFVQLGVEACTLAAAMAMDPSGDCPRRLRST